MHYKKPRKKKRKKSKTTVKISKLSDTMFRVEGKSHIHHRITSKCLLHPCMLWGRICSIGTFNIMWAYITHFNSSVKTRIYLKKKIFTEPLACQFDFITDQYVGRTPSFQGNFYLACFALWEYLTIHFELTFECLISVIALPIPVLCKRSTKLHRASQQISVCTQGECRVVWPKATKKGLEEQNH